MRSNWQSVFSWPAQYPTPRMTGTCGVCGSAAILNQRRCSKCLRIIGSCCQSVKSDLCCSCWNREAATLMGSKIEDLHRRWMNATKYRSDYEDLREEFERYARRLRKHGKKGPTLLT